MDNIVDLCIEVASLRQPIGCLNEVLNDAYLDEIIPAYVFINSDGLLSAAGEHNRLKVHDVARMVRETFHLKSLISPEV
ncbi:hypothetical protein ACJU26_08835 [Acidithiobacillus sp. M4-SHS-6]|uniref:hypothetical protein n=1 Tax=Acidithiobacillus sp. M4-SHS-6 TaxID=3383024 RepID=UPI0039BE56AE